MVMLLMTLVDPLSPKTFLISSFCVAFRVFVVGERGDYEIGGHADH